jgi:hypothetical protein
VKPTERIASPASTTKSALLARLRALLRARGSGAPSSGAATHALVPALGLVLLAALLALPAPALAETCPNEEFRTGPSAALPDCRAYELVTPPFKEGNRSTFEKPPLNGTGMAGVSPDGLHVDINSFGDFGDAQSGVFEDNYELTRTASGWVETSTDLPVSRFPESAPVAATPEMGEFLYEARTSEQPLEAKDFWLREADGALSEIGPFEPPAATAGPPGLSYGAGAMSIDKGGEFLAASSDLSHVVFESPVPWPGDEASGSLYEYAVGRSGPPAPVGVEPDGKPCVARYAGGETGTGISADGSTVFFTCSGELFARVEESRTVAISEPSAADCATCDTSLVAAASFEGASADGSKVFFSTTQPLLVGAAERSASLYEYDFDAPPASPEDPDGRIVPITAGGKWGPRGAEVQDVVAVSEDGSHVYFLAKGALQGASNSQGVSPAEGESNLYLFERDAQFPAGRLSFIAGGLSWLDYGSGSSSRVTNNSAPGVGYPEVTPDGRFLVFVSSADITPGDTSTADQVFEYDAQTGELVRVSIGQNGFNDDGNTDNALLSAELPAEDRGNGVPALNGLAVSDDGAYVLFQSADGLTPGALNGIVKEETCTEEQGCISYTPLVNVYEYHDGNVYLISDGQDSTSVLHVSAVYAIGLSASGEDVFFDTGDQLVPQDQDTEVDIYDARVDGGFPAPVSLLPSCSGDACQGVLSGAPTLLSPGSEFQAGGNPPLASSEPPPAAKPKSKAKPKGCRKGYVKRQTRCVRKPRAKRSAKGRQ